MSRRAIICGLTTGLAFVFLLPDVALAWGPATHIYLGLEVLRSLSLVTDSLAALLSAYPVHFLYGSVAADISMAKKYAPVGRHCHHWHVAWEMYDAARDDDELRATVCGYLCHLAADVTAHNSFVPRQLLLTASTRALGHSYWEHRMDAAVGGRYAALARRVVTDFDHSRADALFDTVLSSTLFSFRTNRRLFRGMIRISDNDSWQAIFDTVIDNSRWELAPHEIALYKRHTFESVAGFLVAGRKSPAAYGDPIGEMALSEAKRIRRRVLKAGGWKGGEALEATADHHFPLPAGATPLWEDRGATPQVAAGLLDDEHGSTSTLQPSASALDPLAPAEPLAPRSETRIPESTG